MQINKMDKAVEFANVERIINLIVHTHTSEMVKNSYNWRKVIVSNIVTFVYLIEHVLMECDNKGQVAHSSCALHLSLAPFKMAVINIFTCTYGQL
jgi:hypothetical protein